jgi:hypoxanthine phosphoribosyltransferase
MQPIYLGNDVNIERLKPAAERIANYFYEEKFDAVIVTGISGQTGAYMVKQAWKKLYPNIPMPHFIAAGVTHSEHRGGKYILEPGGLGGGRKKVLARLEKSLAKYKNPKIVVFDETTMSGDTLDKFKYFLERINYTNVKTCTLYQCKSGGRGEGIDFIASIGNHDHNEVYGTRRRLFEILLKYKYKICEDECGNIKRAQMNLRKLRGLCKPK